MDITTLIGLVLGTAMIVSGMGLEHLTEYYLDMPSVYMVIGGGFASALFTIPMEIMKGMVGVGKNTLLITTTDVAKLIEDMVSYAEIARRDGILALEQVCDQISDEFLTKGLRLAVDGTDPELIQTILQTEVDCIGMRHETNLKIFASMSKYFPAWGMIGTLVGLVAMLYNMSDPSSIGPSMAVAIITTLYGAIVANFITGPMEDKLAIRNDQELFAKEIIIQGVMSIQSGDNPRIVEQKLNIYLAPGDRKESEE